MKHLASAIWINVLPTVTLQSNWFQIFRGEKVTLRCEIHGGGGAQWTYEWRPTNRNSPTSNEYRITAATQSGRLSHTMALQISTPVSLVVYKEFWNKLCPVHPVTEGDPVTLNCRDKEQKLLSNVFFYHNNKLIHNDSREELKISAVSKSDEGFYKCKHSGKESPQSWMAVRGERMKTFDGFYDVSENRGYLCEHVSQSADK
uniref:Ig-like domain-containing protein n=1 Tax=Cyprinodon variegatus TaxID=28743 RepID=A0A3Q2CNS5_CYPVA